MSKFCTTDEEGRPTAFYESDIHGDSIPDEAVEIRDEHWQECIDNNGCRRFVDGALVECDPIVSEYSENQALRDRLANDPLIGGLVDLLSESTGISREDIENRLIERAGV